MANDQALGTVRAFDDVCRGVGTIPGLSQSLQSSVVVARKKLAIDGNETLERPSLTSDRVVHLECKGDQSNVSDVAESDLSCGDGRAILRDKLRREVCVKRWNCEEMEV